MTTRIGRERPLTVGIDVGGTNIRASVVDGAGEVLDTVQAPTPHSEQALEDGLERAVRELCARNTIGAVGLAVAGFVDETRTSVRFAPHLPWEDSPVARRLSDRLGLPVILEHDANAAMWAEYRFGAAAGAHNGVLVAIGTGIGAALLVGGQLYRGSFGVAPELGHLQVVPHGRACPCGKRGCWERYCSGTALVDTALEMLATDPARSTVLARESYRDPGSLTGRRVAGAAQDGDPVAQLVMAEFARWLGLGLAFVSDLFDPDLIVIAGGVSSSAGLFLDEAREHYAAAITGGRHRPMARIRAAQLGEGAGMIGAAELARAALGEQDAPGGAASAPGRAKRGRGAARARPADGAPRASDSGESRSEPAGPERRKATSPARSPSPDGAAGARR
ncbi:glucokinase [Nocardia sp. GAS34]